MTTTVRSSININ